MVHKPGFWSRLFGSKARIVRDANLAAAKASLSSAATLIQIDPEENWIIYDLAGDVRRIRFRAITAWLPNEPTPSENGTDATAATVLPDSRVLVREGLHRTRAMARNRVLISEIIGGVRKAPGWLDFGYRLSTEEESPSTEAIMNMFGVKYVGPPIPAR